MPDGDAGAAVNYALAHLVLHWKGGIRAANDDVETAEQSAKRMRHFMSNWTNLMLGIPYIESAPDNVQKGARTEPTPAQRRVARRA